MIATARPFLVTLFVASAAALRAGDKMPPPAVPVPPVESPFDRGTVELSSVTGAFWSFTPDSSDRETINYWSSSYRLGVMLNTPSGDAWWRGNTELLVEGLVGSVFDGPGDWIAGGGLLLRYNFVQPGAAWVPYAQIGAGVVWNDVYRDREQTLIGRSVEYTLSAAVGVRLHLSDRWAINLEAGYRHVSNADTAPRNTGLDSLGIGAGLVCTF